MIAAYRHRGITNHLFETLESVLRNKQIEVYRLEVIKDNENARKLYDKQDFKSLETSIVINGRTKTLKPK